VLVVSPEQDAEPEQHVVFLLDALRHLVELLGIVLEDVGVVPELLDLVRDPVLLADEVERCGPA